MSPEETMAAIKERRAERVSDPHGADIGDGVTTITVAEGTIRLIPGLLTANATVRISRAGARSGFSIDVVRQDQSPFDVTIVDDENDNPIALLDRNLRVAVRFTYRHSDDEFTGWYQRGPGPLL